MSAGLAGIARGRWARSAGATLEAQALVADTLADIRRVAIVTDAWHPQVNGVVTTWEHVAEELARDGRVLELLTPGEFRTLPCPSYPSIRLAVAPGRELGRRLQAFEPDAIHIATEGPLGHAARTWCIKRQLAFTTSYCTRFPEYVRSRVPLPLDWTYALMRRFHAPAAATLVSTPSMLAELAGRGFERLVLWNRGVDTTLFRPGAKDVLPGPGPRMLCLGRVAVEKNLEAFLDLPLPGTKYVVGDGPDRARLEARYPQARFLGEKRGEDLARHLASADVLVFPSLTDTFGLVMLEAMACGVPVAAYPVTGPRDVVVPGVTGVLDQDLATAVRGALRLDPRDCADYARAFSWRRCAQTLAAALAPVGELG